MKLTKRIVASPVARGIIAALVVAYLRFVHFTTRWQAFDVEPWRAQVKSKQGYIGCFWHARMLMMFFFRLRYGPDRLSMLISAHRDGQLISQISAKLGVPTIVGSTKKGGMRALRDALRAIKDDWCVSFTPDGPRGPRMRAADGIVIAARLGKVPIFAVTYATRYRIVFKSWDRFWLPLPFGRGVFILGAPIYVPADADAAGIERARLQLESTLNEITARADRLCGHAPIEPAPPAPPRIERVQP